MTPNEAYEIAKAYTGEKFEFSKCKEFSGFYLFTSDKTKFIQPIMVNKSTSKASVFNPLQVKIANEDVQNAKEVDFMN